MCGESGVCLPVPTAQRIRFGAFELDRQTGELWKHGSKLKLQGQPIAVLTLLLERPGELVTREEIRKHLWPEDTFVDFEHSLNTHIKKLRQVFDDDAETPRYIETLPRRGYRFIAPVEAVPNGKAVVADGGDIRTYTAVGSATSDTTLPSEPPPAPKSTRWKHVIALTLILSTAATTVYWYLRPRTAVVTAIHQLTNTGRQKILGSSTEAISATHPQTDGTRVYFDELGEGKWHIAQVSTKGGEVSDIDTPSLGLPWIAGMSRDGSHLLMSNTTAQSVDNAFWIFSLPDGPERRIPGGYWWMWFSPRGDRVVYQTSSDLKQLFTARLDGSEVRTLMSLPGELGTYLALSPDGMRVRFATTDGRSWESRQDGSGVRRFLSEFTTPVCCGYWSRNGGLYVFSSQQEGVWNLWAISRSVWPFPGFESRPIQLTKGPMSFRFSTATDDGKRVFAIGETPRGELTVFDPASGIFSRYGSGLSAGFTDFSRDGQWIAYVTHPDGMLWRSRVDGSERMQLTFPPMGPILLPKWSPDGRFIVFTDWKDWDRKIYLVSADGGAPLLLLSGDFRPMDPTWSPDGKSIAYGGPSIWDRKATEVRILNLETKQWQTVPGSQGLFSPRWSPDGRYIAAHSADQTRLFLYSFETRMWKQLPAPSPPHGTYIGWESWSHDSRYLYFMVGSNIYKVTIPAGGVELAVSTASIDSICPVFAWGRWFGLTPDDRILVLRDRSVEEVYALDLEYR